MQQFQPAPVGTAETVPTSVDRALRGVFAFVFFAVTIASIAFSIAASGKPSPQLSTASRLWPRALEWAGITFAAISIAAATVSAITGDGGGYEQFTTLSRITNGALLGTLCCFIPLLVLKYRTRDIHA